MLKIKDNVDLKELATTSFKVKDIVDSKAQTFYVEKEKNKIENKSIIVDLTISWSNICDK